MASSPLTTLATMHGLSHAADQGSQVFDSGGFYRW